MHFGITAQFKRSLTHGVAVLMLGGIVAGCSSAANLTDGLVTNSTSASTPMRPKVPVGNGGGMQAAAQQPAQQQSYPGTQSRSASSQSSITSSQLPPPGGSQEQQRVARAPVPSDTGSAANTSTTTPGASSPRTSSSEATQNPQPAANARAQSEDNSSQSASSGTYKVQSGDTLYAISRKTGASVDGIARANGLSGNTIHLGQELTIPGGNTANLARAQESDEASSKNSEPVQTAAATPSESPQAQETSAQESQTRDSGQADEPIVVEAQDEASSENDEKQVAALTPDATGVGNLRWPVRGRVVSAFDSGNSDGIDIAVPEGTAVHAAENGVVIYAGDGLKGFGNTVLVRHDDGLVTVYGHTSELKVKRGDQVTRGQEIARSGMSGNTDRPKLHFEVREGTSPVDPMSFLQ